MLKLSGRVRLESSNVWFVFMASLAPPAALTHSHVWPKLFWKEAFLWKNAFRIDSTHGIFVVTTTDF